MDYNINLLICLLRDCLGYVDKLKIYDHLVQCNKQYHRNVLLSSFHLNGHTLGFYPQTQNRTTLHSIINSTTGKYCLVVFI